MRYWLEGFLLEYTIAGMCQAVNLYSTMKAKQEPAKSLVKFKPLYRNTLAGNAIAMIKTTLETTAEQLVSIMS